MTSPLFLFGSREALRSFVAPLRESGVGKSVWSKPAPAIVPIESGEGSPGGEAGTFPTPEASEATRPPDSRLPAFESL